MLLVAIFATALSPLAAHADERRIALVIGNGAYQHAKSLHSPARDADEMERVLRAIGFDDVKVMKHLAEDPLRDTLADFEAAAEGADTALVYYSGHGMELGGVNYLIPTDARLAEAGAERREAVKLQAALDAVSGASRLAVLIVDACRDEGPGRAKSLGSGRGRGKGFVPVVADRPGLVIAFATAPGDVALEGAPGELSPYTRALTEQLESQPEEDVRIAFLDLGARTSAYADAPQVPYTRMGDMSHLPRPVTLGPPPQKERALPASPPKDAPLPTPSPPDERAAPPPTTPSRASLVWARIREAREPAAFEVFIATFPDSPERAEAEMALAALITDFRAAQTELKRLGLYRGAVDGKFGSGSTSALIAFEKQSGLTVDGVLQKGDIDALKAAVRPAPRIPTPSPAPENRPAAPETVNRSEAPREFTAAVSHGARQCSVRIPQTGVDPQGDPRFSVGTRCGGEPILITLVLQQDGSIDLGRSNVTFLGRIGVKLTGDAAKLRSVEPISGAVLTVTLNR